MADIRIKDLTTLESASLTGDVFVIDGTTGTRKLSAFSPSFGGNATVTGTLTVNGASTMNGALTLNINASTIGKSGSGNGGNWRFVSDDGTTRWLSGILGGAGETSFSIYDIANSRSLLTATAAGVVQINQTTASTTTSTGALVVSGGVGVGGAVNIGGTGINVTNSGGLLNFNGTGNTTAIKEVRMVNSGGGDWMAIGMTGSAYAGVLTGLGNDEPFIYAPATFRIFRGAGLTNRFDFAADKLKINATTASTSTSSGALVVSGGVGVAGSINTDGTLRFNANSSLPGAGSLGISSTYGLNFYASTGSSYDFSLFSAAGQSVFLVPTGTRNVTFSGTLTTVGNITSGAAITTSAPVGGAGLWELGTYTTTAPSATGYVTIEIGGTVYKLLASNV